MGGSNPGLNTLGGALAVQTKSGHDNPGTELEAYGGSFGRRVFEAETGGAIGNFDYFFTGNYFDEDGWRDLSPTKLYQGFGKDTRACALRHWRAGEGDGRVGAARNLGSEAFLLRRGPATFPFTSVGADFRAASFLEDWATP
jgi:hypothetical protein